MQHTTIAVDVAKSVFEIGISHRPGHVDKHYRLSRNQLSIFFANQPSATVVMEACSSSHYWARQFMRFGHDVKLLPPFYVRPYVQRSKTDRTDVKGMLEAWRNSEIRPVPIKTEAQQQLIALHRVRSTWIATRTARINTARGILREFGIVVADGASRVPARVTELIEDAGTELPMSVRDLLNELVVEIRQLTSRVENVERQLAAMGGETPVVERLRSIPGFGLLTATALIAFVGNVERFPSSRHFACYLGLTPREHSSGLRRQLGHISKRGDAYLRMLLTHGARSVLWAANMMRRNRQRTSEWSNSLMPSFLLYCKPDNIGDPVNYFASNQLDRVHPGDELWGVTSKGGVLILQGHLTVAKVVGRAEAEPKFSRTNLWQAKFYAVAQEPASADVTLISLRSPKN